MIIQVLTSNLLIKFFGGIRVAKEAIPYVNTGF